MSNKLRVVSLFSGAGGMDLGFINAGYEIIWANDFFKEAVETYKKNIGDHIVLGDIKNISSSEIPNDVDVVIGGFPCQGFSVSNNKRCITDERNYLYKEMLRIIKDKKPKYFVAENVKGILSLGKGKVIDMIINDFKSLGYKVQVELINSAEFGVPQARERVFIIGNNIGEDNLNFDKTHYIDEKNYEEQLTILDITKNQKLKKAVTVEETIGDLADIKISYEPIKVGDKVIYNHIASTNVSDTFWGRKYEIDQAEICDYLRKWRDKSKWTVAGIDRHFGYRHTAGHWFRKDNNSGSIPSPEDWWELKKILNFDDKYDKQVTTLVEKEITFEQSLRITNWDRPSATITASSPEIHINKKRRLSVRECARLQTFPDDFIFEGSLSRMYTQIGNAVPVKIAEMIASKINNRINKL